mgnify:CR=1 FL=1
MAVAFLLAGFLKAFRPLDDLANRMTWVAAVPPSLVRFIGAAEILGAIGLVLPALTGVVPWLTPLAAVALVLVMVGAAAFHASRSEYSNIGTNAVLLVLVAMVAYGRWVV